METHALILNEEHKKELINYYKNELKVIEKLPEQFILQLKANGK